MAHSDLGRVGLLVAVTFAAGCVGQAGTAGLANAPGGTRAWSSEDRGQESVANGQASCPEPGKPDPMPNRVPPCPEVTKQTPKPAAPPPAST